MAITVVKKKAGLKLKGPNEAEVEEVGPEFAAPAPIVTVKQPLYAPFAISALIACLAMGVLLCLQWFEWDYYYTTPPPVLLRFEPEQTEEVLDDLGLLSEDAESASDREDAADALFE